MKIIDLRIKPYILPLKEDFHFGNSQLSEKRGFYLGGDARVEDAINVDQALQRNAVC